MTLSMNCYLDIILEIHIILLVHPRLDLVNVRRSGPFCLLNRILVLVNDKITDLKCMEHAIVVFEAKSCVDTLVVRSGRTLVTAVIKLEMEAPSCSGAFKHLMAI